MFRNIGMTRILAGLAISITAAASCAEEQSPARQGEFGELIYVTPAMTDDLLLPTTRPDKKYLSDRVSIFASPGEYEPATFSIYAMRDLKNVEVQAGDLKAGRKKIPAKGVDIRVVKCWFIGRGRAEYIVLTPELLLKDDTFVQVDTEKKTNILKSPDAPRDADTLQPVDIPANTLKQFWVTVHVPENAMPGDYKGTIKISTADGKRAQIRLEVKVLPIKLAKPMLDYMVYYGAGRLDPEGQGESTKSRASEYVLTKSEEQYKAELQNLKAHGITMPMIAGDLVRKPDGSYDFTLLERAMTLVQQAGFGRIPFLYIAYGTSVGTQATPEEIEGMKKWVREVIALSRKHGFSDAYFYGIDEATGEALKAERPAWQAVHDVGGKIFVSAYFNWFELVGDLLDLDLDGTATFAKNIDQIHALGHKQFCMRNAPVGHSQPLNIRCNYGLGNWLAGFDGSASFAYQFATGNIYDDTDSFQVDYTYIYPTVNGVIDTVRWEGWREAVDDVRYLTTLLNAIEQAQAKGEAGGKLVAEAQRWIDDLKPAADLEAFYADPGTWYVAHGRDLQTIRRKMAELIIKLQGENHTRITESKEE